MGPSGYASGFSSRDCGRSKLKSSSDLVCISELERSSVGRLGAIVSAGALFEDWYFEDNGSDGDD